MNFFAGITEIFNKFRSYLINIFSFSLSFYIASLLSRVISLKYSNPYEIVGPLSEVKFNPLNNILRFIFVILFTPLLFIFSKKLIKEKRWVYLRVIFIGLLIFLFFLIETGISISKFQNIDLFHDGEQLGVGAAMYLFGKKSFTDLFFLHGAFFDPLVAFYSFKIFGYSIGSFYLVNSLLRIISFSALAILIGMVIKNEFLYYLSSIIIFCSVLHDSLGRDLIVFVYIFILFLIIKQKLNLKLGFFFASFLSFFTFYLSVDRGFFLLAANFIFLGVFVIIKEKVFIKTNLVKIVKAFMINLSLIIASLLGVLASIVLGILWFGLAGFKEFLDISFIKIPAMSSYMFDYRYPPFSYNNLHYWLPIVLITLSILLMFNLFIEQKNKINRSFMLPVIFVVLSAFYYRSALGRSDPPHIVEVMPFVFLGNFVILDWFLTIENDLSRKVLIYLAAVVLFLFLPFFDYQRIINPANYGMGAIKTFFSLPKVEDKYWLTLEQIKVRDYIVSKTNQQDYVFVFTNESAYYYLFKRQSPTRFYSIWFASPSFYQKEALTDLIKNPPKYIIYETASWTDKIDGIPNKKRLPLINDWILRNYTQDKIIGYTKILRLSINQAADKITFTN